MAVINQIQIDNTTNDIGANSANVSYNNTNVKTALDNINVELGKSKQVITNNDALAYNLLRVFRKDNFVAASSWEIDCDGFYASQAIAIPQLEVCTITLEIKAGDTSLGDSAITNVNMNLCLRTVLASGWQHEWDGVKDIYKATFTAGNNITKVDALTGNYGRFMFGVHDANNKNLQIAAYVDIAGVRFFCKGCYYSATSSLDSKTRLSYRLEWEDTATTVDKVDALIDNKMPFMCSASSEYSPFLDVNTTPRVLVTIVSDDGEIHDYTSLRPYLAGMAEQNDVDIRWSIAVPANFPTFKDTLKPESVNMTATMIRDLVANYGVSVLCHNYNHEYLNQVAAGEQERIFYKGKTTLERRVGVPCIHHCLPGGAYQTGTFDLLKRYFISTGTITSGINTPNSDSFKINRNNVLGQTAETLVQHIQDAEDYVTNNNESAWVCYYTHGQEWARSEAKIKAITEYCMTQGIAMRNYSEAYAEIYPAKDRLKSILGIS